MEEVELDAAEGDVAEQLYARFNPRRYRMDVRQAPLLRVYIAEDADEGALADDAVAASPGGRSHDAGGDAGGDTSAFAGAGRETAEPQPFRNLVAQARLGVSGEEHEKFFREMLGEVEEPTAPFGLLDVQGDGTGIEEARIEVEEGLARADAGASAAAGSECGECVSSGVGAGVGESVRTEGCGVWDGIVRTDAGRRGTERGWGCSSTRCRYGYGVGGEGVEASVRRTHGQLAELLRHEHASLAVAQRCSGVPATDAVVHGVAELPT